MNCTAADQLYVRADGRVPCNCDVGEHVTLFAPDLNDLGRSDYVRDCYNGEPYVRRRENFAAGRPFIDACRECYFFEPSKPFEHFGTGGRLGRIRNLQIEPSFICPIQCESCVDRGARTDPERSPLGVGPYIMSDAVFHKLIHDLHSHRMEVQEFHFCGRGEPLLHPRIGDLIRHARRHYDDALYSAHTSANVKFTAGMLEFDHIVVSIDGACQESYATYRRGGSFDRCLEFLRDAIQARKAWRSRLSGRRMRPLRDIPQTGARRVYELARRQLRYLIKRRPMLPLLPVLRWKYILFEHNDSSEEIREAQRIATRLGVDEMQFVLSHTASRSKKYTSLPQIEDDPIFHEFKEPSMFASMVNEDVGSVPLPLEQDQNQAGTR